MGRRPQRLYAMRRSMTITVLGVIVALGTAGAQAQSAPEAVRTLAGNWEISNADRDRVCTVTLKPDAARTGFRLELDPACVTAIPGLSEVDHWTTGRDAIHLNDARGKPVFDFAEVESGMYEAERAYDGLYFLQSVAAAGPALIKPEQMAGEWAIMRGPNRVLCALTLTTNPTPDGEEGALALQLKSGCDESVLRFAPAFWRVDQGELVLSPAAGQSWRFALEEQQATVWWRVPNRAGGMSMVRR